MAFFFVVPAFCCKFGEPIRAFNRESG